jgi:hypothetical protein
LNQNVKRDGQVKKSKAQSTDVWFEDGRTYTSVEGSVMAQSKKVRLFQPYHGPTPFGGRIHDSGKPFDILKRLVWEAYKRVKANRGATGVDNQSIADFDCERDKNLYRTWNLMASGSHFPPPIKAVKISKKSGGTRTLGLPTVGDRIAQAAVEANEQHDRGKAKAPTKKNTDKLWCHVGKPGVVLGCVLPTDSGSRSVLLSVCDSGYS